MKRNDRIVLFDMDGTLAASRKPVNHDMMAALQRLLMHSEIGIVTGSDLDYVKEQADEMLKGKVIPGLHILPCNGTKYYYDDPVGGKMMLLHNAEIRTKLGEDVYRQIIRVMIKLQQNVSESHSLPYVGHFVSYRGSTLNWCPIGRSAGDADRSFFKDYDKRTGMRLEYLEILRSEVSDLGVADQVEIVLAGDTSFDIYPTGWDKTYALQHFPDHEIFFVGDRCFENGNDQTICNAAGDRCYPVESPEETIRVIYEMIIPRLTGEK